VQITFDCPCGRVLRVSDEHAGRRVKCPACGAVVLVPKPQPKPEVVNEDEEPKFEIVEDEPRETPRARPVKKAKAADDDDDDRPRRKEEPDDDEPPRRKKKKRRRRSSPSDDYGDEYGGGGRGNSDLTALDWVLCIFCPGIGCIVGLVRLISGSSEGGKMMALSLMFSVIGAALRFGIVAATK